MNTSTHLQSFGFLSVTGKDAQKFLQGYTTCDLETLGHDQVTPGAICNIKGRMVCNFLACRIEEGFLLRLKRSLIPATTEFLGKYIVFSKATLVDESESRYSIGLTEVDGDLPNNLYDMSETDEGYLLKVSNSPRYELWTKEAPTDGKQNETDWLTLDLKEGIVWIDESSTEEFIPQMLNLEKLGGVSFEKGCYLGQEIVARMQHRGELKNRLHLGRSEAPVESGDRVLNPTGKSAGQIVSTDGHQFAAVLRAGESAYSLAAGSPLDASEAP